MYLLEPADLWVPNNSTQVCGTLSDLSVFDGCTNMMDLLKHLGVSPRVLNKFWKDFIHLFNGYLRFLSTAWFIHQGVYHGQPADELKMDGICSFISLQYPEIIFNEIKSRCKPVTLNLLKMLGKHLRDHPRNIVVSPVFFSKNAWKYEKKHIEIFLVFQQINIYIYITPIENHQLVPTAILCPTSLPSRRMGSSSDVWCASIPTTMGLGHLVLSSGQKLDLLLGEGSLDPINPRKQTPGTWKKYVLGKQKIIVPKTKKHAPTWGSYSNFCRGKNIKQNPWWTKVALVDFIMEVDRSCRKRNHPELIQHPRMSVGPSNHVLRPKCQKSLGGWPLVKGKNM